MMLRSKVKSKVQDRDFKTLKSAMSKMPLLRKAVSLLLKPEVLSPSAFYDAVTRDILDATDSVTIYSPFTMKPRVEEMLAFIKRSAADFTVYTKPVENFKGKSAYWQGFNIDLLHGAGVKINTVPRMHEKAVIIGDHIAYFGSLNVLSRLNEAAGGDYMLRYDSPLVSALIDDFLKEVGGE